MLLSCLYVSNRVICISQVLVKILCVFMCFLICLCYACVLADCVCEMGLLLLLTNMLHLLFVVGLLSFALLVFRMCALHVALCVCCVFDCCIWFVCDLNASMALL